jgi:hypothetical protein
MSISTWYNVQKWDESQCDWVARCDDGSDWFSTLDNAKYFCNSYKAGGERVRVIREEVVYEPKG